MSRLPISRRAFLQGATALAASGALPGFQVLRSARAAAGVPRTLIAIHLGGGNDTLNTVVPYADPDYYAVRTTLAVPATEVLAVDARQGLHPAMAGIKSLYDRSKVAIVHGVGYPSFDYSHFEAMQIYWTADPGRVLNTGWLGRSLDKIVAGVTNAGGTPDVLTGTAVGRDSPSLISRSFTTPLLPSDPAQFVLQSQNAAQASALSRVLDQPPGNQNKLFDGLLRNNRAALQAFTKVRSAEILTTPIVYPDSNFANGLRFAAQLLRTDGDIQVITMQQGSYDTHENQLTRQAAELGELSAGLLAFIDDLTAHGISNRVLVLLWSEFARRVVPNASAGTDHGSAQAVFLIGDGVRAGVYGTPPSLKPENLIDDGNLPMAVDFRQVYATVLNGWLGLDANAILGSGWGALPVLL